jgi:hypothetical protein
MTFGATVVAGFALGLGLGATLSCVAHRGGQDASAFDSNTSGRPNYIFIPLVVCLRGRVNYDRQQYRHQHNDGEYMEPAAIVPACLSHIGN